MKNENTQYEPLAPAYRRMLAKLATIPLRTAATGVLLLLGISLSLTQPWILGSAVDALEAADPASENVARIARNYAILFLGVTALMNFFRFLYGDSRGRLVQAIVADLRMDALKKLHVLSPVFYGKHDSGQILARVSRDIQKMRPFFGMIVFSTIQLSLLVLGTFAILASMSLLMSGLTLLCFMMTVVLLYRTARRLQPLNRKADDFYDGVSLDIKENIEGVRIVKSFGRESRQGKKFTTKLDRYVNSTIDISDFWSVRMPLADAVFAMSLPLILTIGGYHVIEGTLPKGAIVAGLFYAGRIFRELRGLIRMVSLSQEAGVSAQRFFELIDSPHIVPQDDSPTPLPKGKGALVFEKVSFGYPGAKKILQNVSFSIAAGECVALVGPTGCGKSTLLSLLLRFFDPDSGTIQVDGSDIRRLDLRKLRAAIGCVFQETFLFSATLRDNLAFASEESSDEEILTTARTAQLGTFIDGLPKGLNTLVGERGVTLSGGQKQRTAIARALLSTPRILVLDDAMASVDAETERDLVDSLRSAAKGRTTLIITQRLSGVLLADRAIVLDGGKVIDSGKHADLFKRCDVYRTLFEGQVLNTGQPHVK